MDFRKYFNYKALKGAKTEIPCNVTAAKNDAVTLILWYKGDNATGPPVYSVDLRNKTVSTAIHTINNRFKKRLMFDLTTIPAYLRVAPVLEEDFGEFFCRVDFRHERTRSYVTFLDIVVFPKKVFIVDMDSQLLTGVIGPFDEGSSIDLICKAEGKPPPKLEWYRNNVLVDDSYISLGDTKEVENHIRIENLTRRDLLVVYKCRNVTNETVKPIDVEITTKRSSFSSGKLAEIICQSRGSRPSPNLTWLRNNKPILDVRQTVSFDENVTRSVLTLIPVEEDNQQILTCRSENPRIPGQLLEDTLKLTIFYKPKATLVLGNKVKHNETKEGEKLQMDCKINANPAVHSVKWFFNGASLTSNRANDIIITAESLVVDSLRREHSGVYWCVATNVEGNGRSNEIEVHVQCRHKPHD
ncbi:nephrin-like protein [Leptotrombidium deliense]|uniref:Nephrin-like protein n=1 Tax=Leptotrombidium deliense TaxID=299467 RepID=A0A443SN80_9ACAR|nr:nephrin-like protein [Leptotrombidium deliense]